MTSSDSSKYFIDSSKSSDFYKGVENPIRYQYENGEWKLELPPNPYGKNTVNYERYQDLVKNFNADENFKDWLYMANDQGADIEEHEKYILEMESIYYEINYYSFSIISAI